MSGVSTALTASPVAPPTLRRRVADILVLGKFRISVMAVFTGWAALILEGSQAWDPGFVLPCLIALLLLGMGANSFNQILERDRDATMERTRVRRPLPAGRMRVRTAIVIASAELLLAHGLLLAVGGWLAVACAAFTALYYAPFYTLWLKPRNHWNIVIGGVPGSMGPVIAWAAATGRIDAAAWVLFALIMLWTPPHVWALAIKLREDYARAGIPMLPVVKSIDTTTRMIFQATLVLVIGSLVLPLVAHEVFGPWYWSAAVVLGAIFLVWTWRLWRVRPLVPSLSLFRYSLVYIGLLFLAVIGDGLGRGGNP